MPKYHKVLVLLFLIYLHPKSYAQSETPIQSEIKISEKLSSKQVEWLNDQVKLIKNYDDFLISEPAVKTSEGFKNISFRIKAFSKIKFSSGIEIRFNLHSSHTDPNVGDLSIAITSDGLIYYNFGHVCGGIIHFESKSDKLPQSSEDFFNTFKSDTDDKLWVLWQK
jgi:hypothetical protein